MSKTDETWAAAHDLGLITKHLQAKDNGGIGHTQSVNSITNLYQKAADRVKAGTTSIEQLDTYMKDGASEQLEGYIDTVLTALRRLI